MIESARSNKVTDEPARRVDEEVGQLADDVAERHEHQQVGVGKVPVGSHREAPLRDGDLKTRPGNKNGFLFFRQQFLFFSGTIPKKRCQPKCDVSMTFVLKMVQIS